VPALGHLMVDLILLKTIEEIINSFNKVLKLKLNHFSKESFNEIKNVTLFLVGIIVLVLGTLIIIFDYPQIEYFENIDFELYYSLLDKEKEIHQRLIIEFTIGLVILGLGVLLLVGSFLNRFENGFR